MRKIVREAIDQLTERMSKHVNSMCATEDEVYMCAMVCEIQNLTAYRVAAESGIGEIALHLKSGDYQSANKAMDLMLLALDVADNA